MSTSITPWQVVNCSPVIPVVSVDDPADGVSIAMALKAGGIGIIEVTLRTAAGLEAIRRITAEVDGMLVGAGTVTLPGQMRLVAGAGAAFALSPGITPSLVEAARQAGLPLIPGVATASDILVALEHELAVVKFFPAIVAGGIPALKALAAPFPQMRFCPTGGITLANAQAFLDLPQVACVGGTWLTPSSLVLARDWAGVTELAAFAAKSLHP
jgi:2-dehydro-3-deoxyphosphogluconate aldolase/(4S)-4-hydroxy-2-oxoglutarate aldolase